MKELKQRGVKGMPERTREDEGIFLQWRDKTRALVKLRGIG
jgi:hypothetical protein